MDIAIDSRSKVPLYEQIKAGVRKEILEGRLEHGQALPSVRELAKELNVSMITTKRVYIDLEHEGVIYTVPGKGTYVKRDNLDEVYRNCVSDYIAKLNEAVDDCRRIGVDEEEILKAIIKK